MAQVSFDVKGMSCSACSARVTAVVSAVPGVRQAQVNLLKNTLQIDSDGSEQTVQQVEQAVHRAGYEARRRDGLSHGSIDAAPLAAQRRRLFVSAALSVLVLILAMAPMLGLPLPAELFQSRLNAFIQCAVTVLVMGLNYRFFYHGLRAVRSLAPNMDTLVAMGSGAAFVYSTAALAGLVLTPGTQTGQPALYFDSAAMILTFVAIGKYFEAGAKGKTTQAIEALMALAPATALVQRDGIQTQVPVETVAVGETVVLKAGMRVPLDGVLTQGECRIDASALTGESMPVHRRENDTVAAATTVTAGYALMQVTHVGEETALARIIALVDEASSSKPAIARLADRISAVFVPCVLALAALTLLVWTLLGAQLPFALSLAVSVLVISCPCALGLATPTAIMVGMGRAARCGILFRSAQALETVAHVDTVILDKTGTVTQGHPTLTDVLLTGDATLLQCLEAAVSLEHLSEHPLALAVVEYGRREGVAPQSVERFEQLPGQGIAGWIDGVRWRLGNAGVMTPDQAQALKVPFEQWAAQGKTPLFCLREDTVVAMLAVSDPIRPEAESVVRALRQRGLTVYLVTGDNTVTARAVAARIGIDQVHSQVLPQDKQALVGALHRSGHCVMMVGDGINDAPALVRADVGVAIGSGTDIAVQSAQVVLMGSSLQHVLSLLQLGTAVMRIIRQNLFWAFFYNCLGIPLAAGVFYGLTGWSLCPMLAALAMSASSVTVVSNALRLRWWQPQGGVTAGQGDQHSVHLTITKENIMQQTIVGIDGMSCSHCSASVHKALAALPGVQTVQVDLEKKQAVVTADHELQARQLREAVEAIGFTVRSLS